MFYHRIINASRSHIDNTLLSTEIKNRRIINNDKVLNKEKVEGLIQILGDK